MTTLLDLPLNSVIGPTLVGAQPASTHLDTIVASMVSTSTVPAAVIPVAAIIPNIVPSGLICMWGGLVANIPTGWLLCNGANGTPDLRDRFIKGAATGADPGGTGGAATHGHTTTQPADHAALTHAGSAVANHVFTQPSAHSAHVVTQPAAHSNHAVTQPSAHVFTQPGAHSAHVFTQPGTHTAHAALGTHAHELPFTKLSGATGALRMLAGSIFGTGTSRAPESVSANPTANTTAAAVALSQAITGGTPDAHSAHAGGAVDAHSAHAGGSVDAHAGTAVDAHSAHSATAVDAHSAHVGAAVDAHGVTQPSQHGVQAHSGAAVNTVNSEPAYYALAFIVKS